jgi:hypothetical protein
VDWFLEDSTVTWLLEVFSLTGLKICFLICSRRDGLSGTISCEFNVVSSEFFFVRGIGHQRGRMGFHMRASVV